MSWKALAFSDLHLNNALPHAKVLDEEQGVTDRLNDQLEVIERIRRAAVKHEVRSIFGLGDLFDKSRLDAITAAEAAPALWRLSETAPFYILPGNHECMRSQDGGRNMLEMIARARTKTRELHYMDDGYQFGREGFAFWALGFCNQKKARQQLEFMRLNLRDSKQNVLLLHHSIMGCQVEGGWVCDDGLGADEVLEGWEWAFSGHFHPSQTFGRAERGLYLGSTMQLNFGDQGRPCGYWILEFDGDQITRNFVESGAPRFFEAEKPKEDGVAIPELKGIRAGDYLRRIFRGTSDDWRTGMAKEAERWKEMALSDGYRASYIFKPIARSSTARIFVPGDKDKAPTETELITQYAESERVEVGKMPRKTLRKFGLGIFKEALERYRGTSFDGAKVEIRSLRAKNFCAFRDVRLDLRNAGLVWVSGVNFDSDGAKSNGSAKTTLFRALSWGLFGETTEEKDRDEVIRLGEKEAKVVVRLSGGYRIVRTRRKSSGKVRVERKSGDVWQRIVSDDTQSVINKLLGMDFHIFRNTILYAQDDDQRFLNCKDRERKELLYGLLKLEVYDIAFQVAKEWRLRYRNIADEQEKALVGLEAALGEIDVKGLKREWDAWEYERSEKLKRLKQDAKESLEFAAELASKAPESLDLSEARNAEKSAFLAYKLVNENLWLAKRDERIAEEECSDARVKAGSAATEFRLLNEALSKLDGAKQCPVCHSSLKKGEAAKHMEELSNARAKAESAAKRAKNYHEQTEFHLRALRSERKLIESRIECVERRHAAALKELEEQERADAELGRAKERADEARRAAARAVAQAKYVATETNPISKQLDAAKKRTMELEAEIDEKKASIESDRQLEAVYNFWCDGFGPQGLPSWLLDETMPELSRRANEYLEELADGDIALEFSTQRELKSSKAEFRDEIHLSWTIEGNDNVTRSGGQKRKMELATDFALMDIAGHRAGLAPKLMILDEALDGLDEEGRTRVVALLAKLRARRPSIFVISHGGGMSELFEREIVVEKRGKVSSVREAA